MTQQQDHPEGWTETDEAILRGAMAELANLPRPLYTERELDRMVYRPIVVPRRRRWAREIGAWIVVVGTVALGVEQRHAARTGYPGR